MNRYYKSLAFLCCFVMPTVVPALFWNETLLNGYFIPGLLRYIFTLHVTWLVNSVAHMWGFKPYDKNINPVENVLVSIGSGGEGFHNYHHTFPQDYATSEFGAVYFNFTKFFIDFFALFGQAYDRNKISPEVVMKRRLRTGDMSDHHHHHTFSDENVEHEF